MVKSLRFIFWDQLSQNLSALRDLEVSQDIVLFCETEGESTYVRHHPKKLGFLFSAMRHFAQDLKIQGIHTHYIPLDAPDNTGNLSTEIIKAVNKFNPQQLVLTLPGEWRLLEMCQLIAQQLSIPVNIREDDRFLSSPKEFGQWIKGKDKFRMEYFYREMRKKYKILVDVQGQPLGGKWNYDLENRKPPVNNLTSPRRLSHPKDQITKDVLSLVKNNFSQHFGSLEPFYYAVTREQALAEARHFMEHLLPYFGNYQDAMVTDEPYLYHSLLSSYLNAGLLLPLELCEMAEQAYHNQLAPLNSVEGYIRQIIGWREYVRGIYWHFMPDYKEKNFFKANRPLPAFYWGKTTQMFCISQAIQHTEEHAYSHHIQRLMITGNFALLAGLSVQEVCRWYLEVYSDAHEWVELPNTLGMSLFADGGLMASKPYAASGNYIKRMSNFCQNCRYDPTKTIGDDACPFNALYWDFLDRNQRKLRGNPRLVYPYAYLDKMSKDKKNAIERQVSHIFECLNKNVL